MFKTHASKVVAGADPRVLNAMSLGFLANFTRYDADLDPRITYTGASSRMYFDNTGTLRLAPQNLLTYSQDFSNAAWGKQFTTVTADSTTAPDGTATADSMFETADTGDHYVRRSITGLAANTTYTVSVRIKDLGGRNFRIRVLDTDNTSNGYFARFSPSLGTIVTAATNVGAGTGATASITADSNGFYVVTLSGNAGATCTKYTVDFFSDSGTTTSFAGDVTKGVILWGASLNLSTTAFDYIPTTTAAVYLPRSNAYQDHAPSTLAPLGFLIEEQRTNSIRNNTMQGAVAGTPGTNPTNWDAPATQASLTKTIVGTGTDSGISYLDIQIAGTPSGNGTYAIDFEPVNGVVGATAQAWTTSAYLKLQGGTLTNVGSISLRLVERDAGGGAVLQNTGSTIVPTSANLRAQRNLYSVTTSGGVSTAFVQPRIGIPFTSGAAVDITLRIGLPQLELGAFATSPILTTGAAATRLADVATITGTNFSSFWNASEGTIVAKFSVAEDATSKAIVTVSDATANERLMINTNSARAGTSFRVVDGGVDQCDILDSGAYSAGQQLNVAVAYKANDFAIAFNAGTVGTDASGTIPTVTQMNIGGSFSGVPANVHIQSIADYSKRLPSATLQSLAV
jgi:hypothetical protein